MEKYHLDLLERMQEHDDSAFEELYHAYHMRVYKIAYKICRNDDDAKEISQLTFIQVRKSIHNLRELQFFDSWLYRIIQNKCYTYFRNHKEIVCDIQDNESLKNIREDRDYLLPDASMKFESDRDTLYKLMKQLPNKYENILVKFYFEQHSIEEISGLLSIPEGTVKSRLSVARSLLKNAVVKYEKHSSSQLNFHDAGMLAMLGIILHGVSKKSIGGIMLSTMADSVHSFKKTKVMHVSNAMLVITAGIIIITTIGAGISMSLRDTKDYKNNEQVMNNLMEGEKAFEEVTIEGKEYLSAEKAYFALLHWAHCTIEIEEASQEDIALYTPLYHALKNYNGIYFKELNKQGWSNSFEQRIKQ